jgi:hypothetical protein
MRRMRYLEKLNLLFWTFTGLLMAGGVHADVALEKARFHKCCAMFVRKAMAETGMMLTPDDVEGRRVLRTFSVCT